MELFIFVAMLIVSKILAQYVDLCASIDNRLPCSTPELFSAFSEGSLFGIFVGKNTGEQTNQFYSSTDGCPIYQELYEVSPSFQEFIKDYMSAHEITFPNEHAELVAMATTMAIKPEYAFIQNGCSEMTLLFGANPIISSEPQLINDPPIISSMKKPAVKSKNEIETHKISRNRLDHCSDIGLIFTLNSTEDTFRVVQGHNEDWWSSVADKMSIIHTPDWWGYIYPGQLPGTSFVVNKYGLSFSMNSLYPSVPGYTALSVSNSRGVSYLFSYTLRSVMNATSTDDAIHRLSKYPIYSGYSLNVMSACDKSITNIEGFGNRLAIQSRIGRDQAGTVVHFNRYLNSAVEQDDGQGTSEERLECAKKSTLNNVQDVRNFLGNLTCPVFFTENNGLGESETLASWIADPFANECRMYRLPVDCDVTKSRCYSTSSRPLNNNDANIRVPWLYNCGAINV